MPHVGLVVEQSEQVHRIAVDRTDRHCKQARKHDEGDRRGSSQYTQERTGARVDLVCVVADLRGAKHGNVRSGQVAQKRKHPRLPVDLPPQRLAVVRAERRTEGNSEHSEWRKRHARQVATKDSLVNEDDVDLAQCLLAHSEVAELQGIKDCLPHAVVLDAVLHAHGLLLGLGHGKVLGLVHEHREERVDDGRAALRARRVDLHVVGERLRKLVVHVAAGSAAAVVRGSTAALTVALGLSHNKKR